MPYHLAASRVLLQHIDWEDDTFSLLPWAEIDVPEPLVRSIARVGVLHPPLLKAKPAAGFMVIAGRKRLQVIQEELKAASCTCLVLPAEVPALEGLALGLEDALTVRPLSAVERSIFLRKSGRYLDGEQIASRFFRLLGLAPGTDLREQWRLLDLEEPLLQALHAGSLDEEVARTLGGLPFIDRWALFEVIALLAMGSGDQHRLLEGCRAAALRLKCSMLDILAAPGAKEILEHPTIDAGRKADKLLAWLALP